MKKPFYSKRRLKKMGFRLEQKNGELELSIPSEGSIRQSIRVMETIKSSGKPVRINMESAIASAASFICQDMDRVTKKLFGYE